MQHEYVGTDIVDSYFPVNPLPGMSFHHQSMTEPWPENWNGTFDLVHSRFALPGAGMKSIRDVVMNLVRLVKQGGYIQLVEVDIEDPPKNGPGMRLFGQVFRDVLKLISAGQGMDLRHDTRAWLNEAGIVDIEERLYSIPLGAKARSEDMKKISVESIISTAQGFVELFKGKVLLAPSSSGNMLKSLQNCHHCLCRKKNCRICRSRSKESSRI